MRYVKKNEANIHPSWPNKDLSYGQRDLFPVGNPERDSGSQSEHSFGFIMSVVGRPCHAGLHWTLIPATDDEQKKDIDDDYDDSEYHAPNNYASHSGTVITF